MMSNEKVSYGCVFVGRSLLSLLVLTTGRVLFAKPKPVPEKFKVEPDLDSELRKAIPFRFGIPQLKNSTVNQIKHQKKILEKMAAKQKVQFLEVDRDGRLRYCFTCHALKPDRAQHCSYCGYCVLKFDHHLAFFNTCIGLHNYKFFVQSLCYAEAYLLWVFVTGMIALVDFLYRDSIVGHYWEVYDVVVTTANSLMLWHYLIFERRRFHIANLMQNRTSYERKCKPHFRVHPEGSYNLGFIRNVETALGGAMWLLPVNTEPEDGINYTIRY